MKQRICVIMMTSMTIFCTLGLQQAMGQSGFETAYGNGIHHFFSGKFQEAHDSFTEALKENSRDPRTYYFRGLAAQSLGQDASSDFAMGAKMESAQGGRLSLVNDALERVQGVARVQIEEVRVRAVMTPRRTGPSDRAVSRTFPKSAGSGTRGAMTSKTPSPASDAPAEKELPVVSGQEIESSSKVPMVDTAGSAPTTEKMAPKEPAKVDLPFGNQKDTDGPAGSPAVEKKMVDTEVSPFGEKKVADTVDSPFGEKVPAKEDSPFGEKASGTEKSAPKEISPFDDAPAIDSKPPVEEKKTSETESPFGESKGEIVPPKKDPESAPDDPFGN